jgi:two-component system cell cycle response regulator
LTAKNSKDELIEGLEAGAEDYLIKPFDTQELRVRLQTGFRLVRLQEELIATQAALRELASHDSLTGVWNPDASQPGEHRREDLDHARQRPLIGPRRLQL